ncbi:hypothetical protein IWW54_001343 [Coemansia sp. RSA 2705]|nr:hypothetical protein IWW54_001343 [Coemansia sp. RSA 2705]
MPAAADTCSGAAAATTTTANLPEPGQAAPKRPTRRAKKKKKATAQTAPPTHEETADSRELSRKTQSQPLTTAELSAQAFARRYEEAVKETPFGIIPMLYMDISGRRARRLVLRDIEKALKDR